MEFHGKRVLITGAAGVFGRWITAAFAREGARLALSDSRGEALEALVAEQKLDPADTIRHATELMDETSILELTHVLAERWGSPDIVVNNAGIYPKGGLVSLPTAEFDRIMGVNLRAPFLVTRETARLMIAQKVEGSIIVISSGAARQMRAPSAAYCTSKTAVERLAKGFALELAPHRIRVNVVEPGFAPGSVVSPLTADHVEGMRRRIPLQRSSGPEDAPGAILYLCSSKASFITGAVLSVDGGNSIGTYEPGERRGAMMDARDAAVDVGRPSADPPLLAVSGLGIAIAGAELVQNVSFSLARGEILALVGESGCGKSLTAFSLMGLLPPAARLVSGRIDFEGRDIARLADAERRKLNGDRLSIIFQEPTASLDPLATVGSQIAEALRLHADVSRAEARRAARDMLVAVGIPDPDRLLDRYPFELSGGMCQRVMIAIALIREPALLIADEPTTALDVTIQAQILDLMRGLVAGRGTAILLITHDMGVVADMADRVAVMYGGHIVEIAPVEALFSAPAHPYSALLLASVPRLDATPKGRLAVIEGTVPAPADFGPGCRFAGRCPLAEAECRAAVPALVEIAPGRAVACRRVGEMERRPGAGATLGRK